jgi:hypothetical protein
MFDAIAQNKEKINQKFNRETDCWISDLVGSLTDPIIVMPGGWGDTLPDWIRQEITVERMIENMKSAKGEEMMGTDAEVVTYLYTASLEAPMDSDWVEIYLYMANKFMKRHTKQEMPTDMKLTEKLTKNQEDDLLRFKRWLYAARVRARKERDRSERRESKGQEKQQKEVLQPRMFDF